MYRQNADPNTPEELHALDVSTSKGAHLVGFLLAMSILFAVAEGVTIFAGAPPEIEAYQWVMVAGIVAFAIPAYLVHRKRKRRLTVVRRGEVVKLHIADAGVELEFPLACHGTQMTSRINRVPVHEVYFQLVDRHRRSVLLHSTRGAIHGPELAWFPDDIDRTVTSSVFDVSGAGTLAMVRGWVEGLNSPAR